MFVTPGCSREVVVSERSQAARVTVAAPSATARTDVSALMAQERCTGRTIDLAHALLLAGAMNSPRMNDHDLWLERIAAALRSLRQAEIRAAGAATRLPDARLRDTGACRSATQDANVP